MLRPIFRIASYTASELPTVLVNGTPIQVNTGDAASGAFVSLDVDTQTLWVTMNQQVQTAATVQLAAP